jgi:hypothetical protein
MATNPDHPSEDQKGRDGLEAQPVEPGAMVEPVIDEDSGRDLGEVAGGGEITDLGGDSPSS